MLDQRILKTEPAVKSPIRRYALADPTDELRVDAEATDARAIEMLVGMIRSGGTVVRSPGRKRPSSSRLRIRAGSQPAVRQLDADRETGMGDASMLAAVNPMHHSRHQLRRFRRAMAREFSGQRVLQRGVS